MMAKMRYFWILLCGLLTVSLGLGSYQAFSQSYGTGIDPTQPPVTLIILDASFSMADPIVGKGGESKMTVAKRTVLDVLKRVPNNTRLGLRVYGHHDSALLANKRRMCSDSELLVPIGANNQHVIASQLVGLKPLGATPIHYSLMQAIRSDLANLPPELRSAPKEILLISDGIETCGSDPCTVAIEAQRMGIPVKINVVGFGVDNDEAAKRQLNCIAKATFGEFVSTTTEARLADVLTRHMRAQTQVAGRIVLPTKTPNTAPLPSATKKTTPSNKKITPSQQSKPYEQEYRL
ncbi:MAG: hypothetical protein U0003_04140 [Vampirovibrionales bacterium]